MPLVACPDCEKHVSDAAPSCIHCGRPLRTGTEVAAQTAPQRVVNIGSIAVQQSAYSCPRCGSEDTKKLSVLWRDGVQSINTTTTGVGLAGGHVGVGAARTQGVAQSTSSAIAAPPPRQEEKGMGAAILLAVVAFFAFITFSFGGFMIALIAGAFAGVSLNTWKGAVEYNRTVHPGLMSRWEGSYRCGRCENMYVLGA